MRGILTPGTIFAVALLLIPYSSSAKGLKSEILDLQHEWARIKYQTPKEQREPQFSRLLKEARKTRADHEDAAEAILWEAIILYTYAGERGGFTALGMIKRSKDLLLEAVRDNPVVQDGFVYTALGTLYYKVPGYPIAFGSDRRARKYLQKGLKLSPSGLDSNYFMGDFLMRKRKYARAAEYLRKAIAAPSRPNRPVADAGRKADAKRLLQKAKQHIRGH